MRAIPLVKSAPAVAGSPFVAAGPVVVSDGESRPALAAVRSLGAAGAEVHVLAARSGSLAGVSRHARCEHRVPGAAADPAAWAEAVEALLQRMPNALLLPVTEASVGSVFAFDLDRRHAVAAAPRDAYALAVDKHALLGRAAGLGIEVPHSTLVEEPAALEALPEGHTYPVVVKARRSRWLRDGRWHEGGVHLVRDAGELRQALCDPGLAAGALVQEFVPGHGEGLFYLAQAGAVRARFAHRRLREKPPSGGVSVLSECIVPDPGLDAAGERLLAGLGWNGVAMLEFRRTPDGRAVLMELNPRLWGSLQLAIDAGVDFPGLLVALHRGGPLPEPRARIGTRTRWLLGDLDHLWIALRRPEMRRALGRTVPVVLWAFLRSFFDGSRLEVLRRDDPRPFWAELRAWLA